MSARVRVFLTFLGTAAVTALVIVFVFAFLRSRPVAVPATREPGRTASLTLQTVGALGFGPRPDWVSYLVRGPEGRWVHSTVFSLPAHSTVEVTVLQYDSATGLRNPFWAKVQGTVGGTMTVDGKEHTVVDPNLPAHTFAVPDLGVTVPFPGVGGNEPNQCSAAPCRTEQAHRTITFRFRTGKPGVYRWQCFVPCAAGTINGNGGPMQTIGYMDGLLVVE